MIFNCYLPLVKEMIYEVIRVSVKDNKTDFVYAINIYIYLIALTKVYSPKINVFHSAVNIRIN